MDNRPIDACPSFGQLPVGQAFVVFTKIRSCMKLRRIPVLDLPGTAVANFRLDGCATNHNKLEGGHDATRISD